MSAPDPSQLPHLLALLDDESRLVRDSVLGKLVEFGSDLEIELQRLPDKPSKADLIRLRSWVDDYRAKLRSFNHEGKEGTLLGSAVFKPGDLVRHRRYEYRGLVVDHDLGCKASEDWYRKNRSQPDLDQPWYHVLVHGSHAVTYAAQTSLQADESEEEIEHQLLEHFFDGFEDGKYLRNKRLWPKNR
ncbi:MAG: heat shock protein HspQ [Planctomycetota bacterium]